MPSSPARRHAPRELSFARVRARAPRRGRITCSSSTLAVLVSNVWTTPLSRSTPTCAFVGPTAHRTDGIKAYVAGLEPIVAEIAAAFDLAYRKCRAQRDGEKETIEGLQKQVSTMAEAARDLANEAAPWGVAEFTAFAALMAEHNEVALTWALDQSNGAEPLDGKVFSPELKGLVLIIDDAKGDG